MSENNETRSSLDCGSMDENGEHLWNSFEYWCEGVLMSTLGTIGFIGNIASITVLATR